MMRDALRDAIRVVRGSRWSSFVIVITLGLGTGLNASVLALVYGILLRPLPYRDPGRLVHIEQEIKLDQLESWTGRLHTTESVGAVAAATHVLRGLGAAHVVKAAFVSDNFLDVLGLPSTVPPANAGARPYGVFISERAAGVRDQPPGTMIGRVVALGDARLPILAVLPRDVEYPADGTELWIPGSAAPAVTIKGQEDARRFRLIARMKPAATVEQVIADATAVQRELTPERSNRIGQPVKVRLLRDSLYGSARPVLAGFLAAAGLVLLVACANVSTLLLGRSASRESEIAIRLALGASRARIVASQLAEGLLLAAAGSVVGVGLAFAATRGVRAAGVAVLPRLEAVGIDWPVLSMAILVAIAVALLCTAGPAMFASRTRASSLVRSERRPAGSGRRRVTAGLVVAQIALSTTLVVAAGLLGKSLVRLLNVDIGVDTASTVTMKLMLADTMRLAGEREPFVSTLLDRVRALPGVRAAGIGSGMPPNEGTVEMAIRLVDGQRETSARMHLLAVSSGYLDALGARLIDGRAFDERERTDSTPTVVISRSTARELFNGRNPVGQDMPARGLGNDPRPPRVIGVVDDVHYAGLDIPAGGAVYMPWHELPIGVVTLVVRSTGDPRPMIPGIRRLLQQMDPELAVEDVRTLESLAGRSIGERRLQIASAILFALLTLTLAIIGLASTLMRSVTERQLELGIRAALGGTPGQLRRLILARGALYVTLGLACGAGAALVATRFLAKALYGVTPHDPATFIAVALAVLTFSILACLIPARRAAGVDPAALMRSP
jgi:predicted permease